MKINNSDDLQNIIEKAYTQMDADNKKLGIKFKKKKNWLNVFVIVAGIFGIIWNVWKTLIIDMSKKR